MANSNKKNQAQEPNKIDELNESLTNAGTKIAENKKKLGCKFANSNFLL